MKIEDIIRMALMSESAFADKYEIPSETLFHWVTYDINHVDPPKYVLNMLERIVREDLEEQRKEIKAVEYWQVWTQDGDDIFSAACEEYQTLEEANKVAAQKRKDCPEGTKVEVTRIYLSQDQMIAAQNCVD